MNKIKFLSFMLGSLIGAFLLISCAQDLGVCPVMGGKASKKYSYAYKGKTYYFCCPSCIGSFKSDPDKYI